MCGSMVDIQSPTAEISRGKKIEETTGQEYNVPFATQVGHNNNPAKFTKVNAVVFLFCSHEQ